MKHLLLTTIAAVVLVGCATTQSPEPPTAKAPDISIHKAVEAGNIEAVKQHLAAGADVNAKDSVGWTPLHCAAFNAEKEIVELLIAAGADVNAKDNRGKTPLDKSNTKLGAKEFGLQDHASKLVKFGKDGEIASLLIKHGGKTGEYLSIHGAADRGDIETVKQHLAAGADVNAKDGQVFSGFFHNVDKNELSIRDLTTDKSSPSRQEIYSNTPRAAP